VAWIGARLDGAASGVSRRAGDDFNELPWIAGAAVVLFLILILTACAHTETAIAALPEGWGGATWNLIEGVALDAWALLEWVADLLL
jgi:uncharacterized caspase-like protein